MEWQLEGWCMLWVANDSSVPRLTANLADERCARTSAATIHKFNARCLAIIEANHLVQLASQKPFELSEVSGDDLDEITSRIAGCWPEGWSEDTLRRVIVGGANMLLRQRAETSGGESA